MDTPSEIVIEKKPSPALGLQDYLSIGYVFLLILGVCHETIYYKFLGINILDYSSVLDVLISPISVMSGNLLLGLAVLAVMLLGYGYVKLLPRYYKWLGTKKKYQEGKNKLKLEKANDMVKSKNGPLIMSSFYIFCVFIGLGIGRGQKVNRILDEKEITLTHIITFDSGDTQKIRMLGKNSLYVFYVTAAKEEVSIAPIEGNIKLFQKLKED
ncbi:MAG: hypothetical protein ACSHXF_07185 [Aquaticitalea sp.]